MLQLMFSHWDISRERRKRGGTFFCFNSPSWQEKHPTAGRVGERERERFLKHIISSVFSAISADLQDVPPTLY